MSDIKKHGIGTIVELTKNTNYTTLSDGYFKIGFTQSSAGTNESVIGSVNGDNLISLNGSTNTYAMTSLFVRKGSVLNFSGTTKAGASFHPLV